MTAEAAWRLCGVLGARISRNGAVDAAEDGDVEIAAQFEQRRARVVVRLVHDQPGQVLAAMHGTVYAEVAGLLQSVAHARVEVISGPSAGLSTTTDEVGEYELVGIVPGEVVLRGSKVGFAAGDGSAEIVPGDNELSVLIDALPPMATSSL